MLEPFYAHLREAEATKTFRGELVALGIVELLPEMLRDARARQVLAREARQRWGNWARFVAVAAGIYGLFPVVLVIIEVGRIAGWWR